MRRRDPSNIIYHIALHDFGRWIDNDYIVKGKLFDTLFPGETGRVEATLGDLIKNPVIVKAVWSHPCMRLCSRSTVARKSSGDGWEPYVIDEEFLLKFSPLRIDAAATDIGRHIVEMFGPRDIDGRTVVLWAAMPPIIAVVLKGGRKFDEIRSFTLTAQTFVRASESGATSPPTVKTVTHHYHVRAVLNLSKSDIHVYHKDTAPVMESLDLGLPDGESPLRDDYRQKLERGRRTQEWTFEGAEDSEEFVVIYQRYDVEPRHGEVYQPPDTGLPEYFIGEELQQAEAEWDDADTAWFEQM
ncbi:hypothetical protein VTK56DRAFT_7615 [Thermocarpiscus australiensis]